MSDPNRDLINRIASRAPAEPTGPAGAPEPETPRLTSADWNMPIDTIQADCLTARQVIRGEIAAARERVAAWQPRPLRKEHR